MTAVFYLVIFDKPKIEQIKNNIILQSYKIINFNNDYSQIKIVGNVRTKYEEIAIIARKEILEEKNINNQIFAKSLKEKIKKLSWVDEVFVVVSLQGVVNINISEHQPFAIWRDDKKYIVSRAGKIIAFDDPESFGDLIVLTGNGAYENVRSLFNILAADPEISKDVYSATWVGKRRWDIRFKNGLLAKLPSEGGNNIKKSWDSLIKIYNMKGSLIGLKAIDLRIAKRIYLEYDIGKIQELKNL
ncbi:MAG: cell division septal protein FtsQ [Rickettsiales bacterium]|jgi:cell division septal protein FtsQ